ncbi:MAG: T9SS type A sorting domain-containing protein [Bacteroidota bacterium]|nr:T9SS type A sorting domain-containing protein [Bacteroidota bacterium]
MKKVIFYSILSTVCCILLHLNISAQVKTKIYFESIPQEKTSAAIAKGTEMKIIAPAIFGKLLRNEVIEDVDLTEYKNKFAVAVKLDIDFIKAANRWEENGFVMHSLSLNAENALNVSVQFSEFSLSENSTLSIFTSHEMTDSITAKENNLKNIWATRIYQGGLLHILLKTPGNEEGFTKLKLNQIGFGYKKIGGGFFGNPGASSTCNINVTCPQGNGWENERNSVALIVSGGQTSCTGTLIMNTCNTNIPYLLTANHCIDGNLQNWVFQFQTWSNTCTPNGTFREDLQFNGCQLRSNLPETQTDFALVELNQIPPANSGITYSGWTREPNPALSTTAIHHPRGDLMKISHDFQVPVSVSYQGGANDHWRASFDQGIVQHGSSGSALFDENHRIIGQLHGNQNNICGQNNNFTCWCITQIPSIGEYGRFDISWTGGGTNATRLNNWLDPNGTNAISTTTTNIAALISLNNSIISGDNTVCGTSNPYTITSLPTGATVIWTIPGNNGIAQINSPNSLQTTLTKISSGVITLSATITFCGQTRIITKDGITIGSGISTITGYYRNNYGQNTPLIKKYEGVNYVEPNVNSTAIVITPEWATATWSLINGSCNYWSQSPGPDGNLLVMNLPQGADVDFRLTNNGTCETEEFDFLFFAQSPYGGYYSISPNPTIDNLTVSVDEAKLEKQKIVKSADQDIRKIVILDKTGIVQSKQLYGVGTRQINMNVSGLTPGVYIVRIFNGKQWTAIKLIKE